MSRNVPSMWVHKIENGYVITASNEKTFCVDNIEVIKTLADIMNIEIGVEIKEKT